MRIHFFLANFKLQRQNTSLVSFVMDGQLKVISHAELRLTDNEESVIDLEAYWPPEKKKGTGPFILIFQI